MLSKPIIMVQGLQRVAQQGDLLGAAEIIGTLTTIGAGTLTGAVLANSILIRTGSTAAFTDTTDTAANIVAALSGSSIDQVSPGSSYRLRYNNATVADALLAAGTGVTLAGNLSIPRLTSAELLIQVTNSTPTSVVPATTVNGTKAVTGMTQAQTSAISIGQLVSGTGITSGTKVAGITPGTGVTLDTNATADGTLVALTFSPTVTITNLTQLSNQPDFLYTTNTAGTAVLAAGDMTGAKEVTCNLSGQAAITKTTRTADQMIADMPNAQIGMKWKVRFLNRNSNTLTVAAGNGVTITGATTALTVTWIEYLCSYTAASTIGMQAMASAAL